ncbi:tetratricopeptide repeat protein [Luteimonas changyuni]|uniref:tetratricopeptide repeat protein n=1 Tax=Luteimonas sp. MJ145 TaxID=3129234 RepID=UPI0031BACF25
MTDRGNPDPRPAALDEKSAHEWSRLSAQVLECRRDPFCSRANATLDSAAGRDLESPVAPVFRLWAADNLLRDGEFRQALAAYDAVLEHAQSTGHLVEVRDLVPGALRHKAHAAASLGDVDTALAVWQELARYAPEDTNAVFQAGLLAHRSGRIDEAADFYRRAMRHEASHRTDDAAELARRELLRMASPATAFIADERQLADMLADALERGDVRRLQALLTSTHFAVGTVGGHTWFEADDLVEALWTDLAASEVKVRRTLLGSGAKRYLQTEGWRGKWFSGPLIFLLVRGPRGWQWDGVAIAAGNALWLERWRPAVLQKNQALPFELAAPWPHGQCFMAGGFNEYIGQQAAILAAAAGGGFIFGGIAAAALTFLFSTRDCGFGIRGFYFNQFTHVDDDAFAIDFTRYRQYVPYDNESGGTPVLAARAGIVDYVYDLADTGDSGSSNTVYIHHADPDNSADTTRFRSQYLHMEGAPRKITVSQGMQVQAGSRLGSATWTIRGIRCSTTCISPSTTASCCSTDGPMPACAPRQWRACAWTMAIPAIACAPGPSSTRTSP